MTEKKNKYSYLLTILKSATYVIIGTIGSVAVQLTQSGYDLPQALLMGCGVGLMAGIKNIFKHTLNVDLDLAKLKK